MQFKRLLFTITFLLNLLPATFAQEPTLLEHGGGVWTVEFSPVDVSVVASAGESNVIKLWNLKNNTTRTLRGHTDIVLSVAFSPDGELLASVSDDGTIKLWNVRTRQNIATLREGTQFVTVAFSPDGQLLATGGGRHVKLWDVGRRVEIATLQHDNSVHVLTFSPDGQRLAVGDGSDDGGLVKVWDVQSRKVVVSLDANPKSVHALEFSLDSRYLTGSGWNGHLKVWDTSNWKLLRTIPHIGSYDFTLSPDAKVVVGTEDGYVSFYWVEDGTKVAQIPGAPAGWVHPVDFSHDGGFLAIAAEDGIVRLWRIDTSSVDGREEGAVQILHIDTYFQQLPKANSANGDDIPDPAAPAAIVRDFYELDPYYEQWINVGGLPVIASAEVNPYALKEAAWIIEKMIGHRPDVLRAMVSNKARFSVIPYTEVITEIPEYHYVGIPDFVTFYIRGWGGSEGATASSPEENILNYPGETETEDRVFSLPLHEFGHAIHLLGFNTLDPTFDKRLQMAYEAAMEKGLWLDLEGTYVFNRREYWAEGTHAWFFPNGFVRTFDRSGNTRQALKAYDPELAALLVEVYGDREWRYTPVLTRTHQPHLQGFNPQDSPTFEWWPELVALHKQMGDPNSNGDGRWVDLQPYDPSELPRLTKLDPISDLTTIIFVNFTETEVLFYEVYSDGSEHYTHRHKPGQVGGGPIRINQVLLVKDADGKNIAAFQAVEKTGRALIGIASDETNRVPQEIIRGDVNKDSKVNTADLRIVVNALGKKAGAKPNADINEDGNINVDDLLLVIEHLDDPVNAAAPALGDIKSAIPVSQLQAHLKVLHAESDGSSKYWRAIAFLEYLITAARPNQTVLLANYPNPFNPETWIPYQLAKPAEVTLCIYAVNGALIRTLALGHQPAGIYHSKARAVYWDGKNEAGEVVASGVYLYTLSAGDFTATRKMLILK